MFLIASRPLHVMKLINEEHNEGREASNGNHEDLELILLLLTDLALCKKCTRY
jgi:hypothetical protein